MRVRWLHTSLAVLILIQSVVTLAAVPVAVLEADSTVELLISDLEYPGTISTPPCHGDGTSSAALQSLENCCDVSESTNCAMSCSILESVVSCDAMLGSMKTNIRHSLDSGYASIRHPLYELFRPPRRL